MEARIDAPIKELKLVAVRFTPCAKHHNMNIDAIGDCPDCDLNPAETREYVWRNPDFDPRWRRVLRRLKGSN